MAASKAPAVKKSNTGKVVFVVVALSLACISIAWQFGLFGGGATAPDPSAPPAVVEDAETKAEREEVEEKLKDYADQTGESASGS